MTIASRSPLPFPYLISATIIAAVSVLGGCKQPEDTSVPTSGSAANNAVAGASDNAAVPTVDATVGKAKPYQGTDILLGEYGDLTGDTADFGQSTRDGVALAVDETNASGGVLGKKVRVQLYDNNGQPTTTSTVVRKLVSHDNVLAIIGEVASGRSIAGAKICQPAGVPMLSPTSTNPSVTQIGDYIFRACFIDPLQGRICSRFALNNLKLKTAAVLTDVKNPYSVGLTKYFIEDFEKNGGKIIAHENYKKGDDNFRSQLASIKATNPEVIFLPGYYSDVAVIAKQARSVGITQPMMGGDGWESEDLLKIGGAAVQDCYFSTHASPESRDPRTVKFVAAFKKKYNAQPNGLSIVAYDSANMMLAAIKKAGSTDREKIRAALAATKDFPGVSGNITLDANRNVVKQLVILQVKGDAFKYVATIKP